MPKKRPTAKKNNPFEVFRGKTILVGLTGSIALYKAGDLVRRLRDQGADVICLMTAAAQKFVTPLTFRALSGNPVASDMWEPAVWKTAHIEYADRADLLLVAPASADILARLASGLADDLLTSTALATKAPVLIAPAMHENMWLHPATQSNVKKLKSFGYGFVGPEWGPLAQGRSGWGRFSEIEKIIGSAGEILGRSRKK